MNGIRLVLYKYGNLEFMNNIIEIYFLLLFYWYKLLVNELKGGVKGIFSLFKIGNMFDRIVKYIMIVYYNFICVVRLFVF